MSAVSDGADNSLSASVQQQKHYLLGELRNGYTTHHKLKQQISEVHAEVSSELLLLHLTVTSVNLEVLTTQLPFFPMQHY